VETIYRQYLYIVEKNIIYKYELSNRKETRAFDQCWRHTVPKLTPDGHTNMEFWISREDGPELGQQPMNSDANRRSHDGTRTTNEGNTKMWIFYSSLYPQDTRRPHDGYTASYWEYDAFELEHEGVTWPPDDIKLSAVGNSVADRRHDDNNN
jgi:hypothetical protein